MSSDSAAAGLAAGGEGREGQPDASPRPGRCNVLLLSFLSLGLIAFGLWVVSAGKQYREEYAQDMEGWRVGSSREVEITLVKEDDRNLACASDQVFGGLRCGYRLNLQAAAAVSPADPQLLQPYNTVESQLLLGAGLWTSSDMKQPLPAGRFTVLCSYNINGMVRAAAIRFAPTAPFDRIGKTIPVGALSDCTLRR
jgi:hypothetical protein